MSIPAPAPVRSALPPWVASLSRFETTREPRAAWQLANTLIPYLGLLALMTWTVRSGVSYWITLALAVPAAGFMVRLFILFHDCVHGSFVRSPRLRRLLGRTLGVLVFTPFGHWGHSHLGHHVTSGDLDRRGIGDVAMLTVDEYRALPRGKRLLYRLTRDPLLMLLVGPLVAFLIVQRIPPRNGERRLVASVWWTNLAVACVVAAASFAFGFGTYLKVQLPVLYLGGMGGVWLFFVQHQFVPTYWVRRSEWSPLAAALEGSSYYKLPKVLQWFSGNIGIHHVHHLRPRIPNYRLQECLDATPELRRIEPLTIRRSLKSLRVHLWDESASRYVTFRAAARRAG